MTKIEEIEASGGVEAVARAMLENTGIWGDFEVRGYRERERDIHTHTPLSAVPLAVAEVALDLHKHKLALGLALDHFRWVLVFWQSRLIG